MASAEKVARPGIAREPGFVYYLRGADVYRRAVRATGGGRLVKRNVFTKEEGFLYFLDRDGDVARRVDPRKPATPSSRCAWGWCGDDPGEAVEMRTCPEMGPMPACKACASRMDLQDRARHSARRGPRVSWHLSFCGQSTVPKTGECSCGAVWGSPAYAARREEAERAGAEGIQAILEEMQPVRRRRTASKRPALPAIPEEPEGSALGRIQRAFSLMMTRPAEEVSRAAA